MTAADTVGRTRFPGATVVGMCAVAAAAAASVMLRLFPTGIAAALILATAAAAALAGWDLRTHRLPNRATAGLAAAGLAFAVVLRVAGQIPTVWPAFAGLILFGMVGLLEALPRDALGGGDAKLLAAAGSWSGLLGWGGLLPTLLCMHVVMMLTLAAARLRRGSSRVVMGPAIAAGLVAGWTVVGLLA